MSSLSDRDNNFSEIKEIREIELQLGELRHDFSDLIYEGDVIIFG